MTLPMENSYTISQNSRKWQDSQDQYGYISRILHWLTAVLVILQFLVVIAWRASGKNEITLLLSSIGPHGSLGLLILTVTLFRLGWAWKNRKQRPPPVQGIGGKLARLVHTSFYIILLFLPVFALLRQYGEGYEIRLYGMTLLSKTDHHIPWMVAPAELLHSPLSWLLFALIIGHIAIAFVHRLWLKDKVLARMAG